MLTLRANDGRPLTICLFFCFDFGFFGHVSLLRLRAKSTAEGECCKWILQTRLREESILAYRGAMRHFVFRWIITTVAVMVAPAFVGGIRYDTAGALIGAALLLGILNAFVRPVLLILSAPLILVTLGFFILVINALMLYWVPSMVMGFHVDGFGSAFWGAIHHRHHKLVIKRVLSRKRWSGSTFSPIMLRSSAWRVA